MQDADFLFVLAEVAVAFAGFASIVALFGQRRARDDPRVDALRLRGMLESSLIVVGGALAPYALSRLGMPTPAVWRVASGLLAVACGLSLLSGSRRSRSVVGVPMASWIRWTIGALYWLPILILPLAVLGVLGERASAAYLWSLLLCLALAGIGFFRIMVSFISGATVSAGDD